MWVFMFIVFVLPEIQAKFYSSNVTDFSKCKVHYSRHGGSYTDFFEIADESRENDTLLDFHFSVLAPSDAHILLSPSSKLNRSDPAYEIVLGAGGNMFSDIRRAQKSAVKASVRLKGILSALDIHSFWLHVSKDGLIEVGREGEELAFISWTDPNPLPLKYFSFGTWPGTEAKWFYDCPREDNITTDSKEVEKELTDLARLRMDLLTLYDPYVRPVLDHLDLTMIYIMQLVIHYISLDEFKSVLSVKGQMKLVWTDEKMIWNPDNYGKIKSLHLVGRQIWQPDLMLYNSPNSMGRDILGETMMVVTSEGSVEWTPPVNMEVWCDSSEGDRWPADIHFCEIFLGFWADFNYLQLRFNDVDGEILGDQFKTAWEALEVTAVSNFGWNNTLTTGYSAYTSEAPFLKLTMKIKRNSSMYRAVFYAPIFVVSLLILATFWVSPFGNLKVVLGCLQLIIMALASVNLAGFITVHSEKIPSLVCLYRYCCLLSTSSLSFSILVIVISRGPYKSSFPYCIWKIMTSCPVQTILCLPKIKIAEEYGELEDEVSTKKHHESVQMTWISFGTFIDRIGFIMYFILATYPLFTLLLIDK